MVYTLADDYALRASNPGKFDRGNVINFPTNNFGYGPNSVFPGGYYAASDAEYKAMERAQEKDYEFNKKYEGFGYKEDAKSLVDRDEIENLKAYLTENRKDDAAEAFQEMITNLKSRPEYSKLSEKELRSMAKQIYEDTTGERLADTIDNNCNGGFWQGVCGGLTLGICSDSNNADDLKEQMLGKKKPISSTCGEVTGNTVGGAAAGAAIGAGIGVWFGGIGAAPGAAIGGVVGGAVGFVKGLFS